jgi:hypothetical protein
MTTPVKGVEAETRSFRDRSGRPLERGAQVENVGMPMFSGAYTVVALFVHDRGASVGLYHGPFEDYEGNFCIPYVPAEPSGDDFVARDLELIPEDQATNREDGCP